MNKKLTKIHESIFDYIATIEDLEEKDYHILLAQMNNLIGQILQIEDYIKQEKIWQKESKKIIGVYANEKKENNLNTNRRDHVQ